MSVVVSAEWSADGFNGIFRELGKVAGGGTFTNPHPTQVFASALEVSSSTPAKVASQAIDGAASDFHGINAIGQWWMVDAGFGRAFEITRFGLYGRTDGGGTQHPRNFVLEGSNDNKAWTSIYTAVDVGPGAGTWWSHSVGTPPPFRRLRIRNTGLSSLGDAQWLIIGEFEAWGSVVTTSEVAPSPNPRLIFDAPFVSRGFNGILHQLGKIAGGGEFINPHPTQVTASQRSVINGDVLNYGPHRVMDGATNSLMHTPNDVTGQWWQIDLGPGREVLVEHFGLVGRADYNGHHPRNFKLQGSNNGTVWTDLLDAGNNGPGPSTWWSAQVDTTEAYRYLRLQVYGPNSDGATYLSFAEFEVWGSVLEAAKTFSDEVMADAPHLRYRFANNWDDAINGRNATSNYSAYNWESEGLLTGPDDDGCLRASGTGYCAYLQNIEIGGPEFAIEVLVQNTASGLRSYADRTINGGWGFRQNDGVVEFFQQATGIVCDSGSTLVNDGERHLVFAVYDGTHMRLYVDGPEVGNIECPPPIQHNWVIFGSAWNGTQDGNYNPYLGLMDELVFYDHSVTSQRVLAHAVAEGLANGELEPEPEPDADAIWFDGTTAHSAIRMGWFDGSTVQPVELLGQWDGTDIQPVIPAVPTSD